MIVLMGFAITGSSADVLITRLYVGHPQLICSGFWIGKGPSSTVNMRAMLKTLLPQLKNQPQASRIRRELVLEVFPHRVATFAGWNAEAVFPDQPGCDKPHVVHG